METNDYRALEPHPEDLALREEIARLRASLTALLLQKDDLLLVQCRRIEAAYLRRFGALELKVYECWCDCLRAKRKAKMIRACRNRREQANESQIEAALDQELSEYREELTNRFRRVESVMERREGPGLTQRGQKELKDLYRKAVKALHPDLHPGEDQERERTLDQAMRAYRAGDLETLRTICDSLEPTPEDAVSTLDELRMEVKRLRAGIRSFDEQLEEIKSKYPFSARVYLEDEAQGRAREAELKKQLQELRDRTARYEAEIARMLDPESEEEETL